MFSPFGRVDMIDSRIACILAAGTGSRLKSRTKIHTKCMVEVGGVKLIASLLEYLHEAVFDKIVIVTGHGADELEAYIKSGFPDLPISFIRNINYATTNNIFSLQLAVEELSNSAFGEVAIFESDVWVRSDVANEFLANPKLTNHVLMSPYEYWMDGTATILNENSSIAGFVSKDRVAQHNQSELYKTCNWYRFEQEFFSKYYMPFLNAYIAAYGSSAYYEDVLKIIVPVSQAPMWSYSIDSDTWMEIDDEEDLRRAEILALQNPVLRMKSLRDQFGGYWKNSTITDLTLLENPFFPPASFWKEMTHVLPKVAQAYPSRQSIIASIFAKTVEIEAHNVVIGAGASELLSILLARESAEFSIPAPYFLEYERLLGKHCHPIGRKMPTESLWESLEAWRSCPSTNLIIVSPNNPTGEALDNTELEQLFTIAQMNNKLVILDESFVDFSTIQSTSLRSSILGRYSNLVIVKSLGKSYGLGGVRLGVLATSNIKIANRIRTGVPIWNVSSIGEVALDLLPKYKKQYAESLSTILELRDDFENRLRQFNIAFIPSQANFVLVFIRQDAVEDIERNFADQNILIKPILRPDLPHPAIRIAIKKRETIQAVLDIIKSQHALFVRAGTSDLILRSDSSRQ